MRNRFSMAVAMGLSCLMASAAVAQTAPEAEVTPPAAADTPAPAETPAPAPVAAAPAFVPKGTPIVIEITELVTSRTAVRDQMFNLKLAEPVLLNGVVVIPEGTPGKGQVVDAAVPGMAGKPGKLVLAVRYLEFQGQQIPIRGLNLGLTGRDKSGTATAVTMAAGIIGLAVVGGHMQAPAGTRGSAKLGADFIPAPAAPAAAAPQEPQSVDAAPVPDTAAAAPPVTQ